MGDLQRRLYAPLIFSLTIIALQLHRLPICGRILLCLVLALTSEAEEPDSFSRISLDVATTPRDWPQPRWFVRIVAIWHLEYDRFY